MYNNFSNNNSYVDSHNNMNSFQRANQMAQHNSSNMYNNFQSGNRGFPQNTQSFGRSMNTLPLFQPHNSYNMTQVSHATPTPTEYRSPTPQQRVQKSKVNAQAVLQEIQKLIEDKFIVFKQKVSELGVDVKGTGNEFKNSIRSMFDDEIKDLVEYLIEKGGEVKTDPKQEEVIMDEANKIYKVSQANMNKLKGQKRRIMKLADEHKRNMQMLKDEEKAIVDDIERLNLKLRQLKPAPGSPIRQKKKVTFMLEEPVQKRRRKPSIVYKKTPPVSKKPDLMELLKIRLRERRKQKNMLLLNK